ncbi:MAG: ribosome maturation factor RimM, partial [Anaerolineae bacterium]
MPKKRPQPQYLAIAQIVAPHGIRGEVRAVILTDFPERFARLETVYLGEEARPVRLEGYR